MQDIKYNALFKVWLPLQIGYHNEFQKGLGKYTVVADDPETKRLLDNTQKFSMVM